MESSSHGKREWETKAVAVKLQSKKVDWRLAKEVILCTGYIERLEPYYGVVEDNGRSRYYNRNCEM